MSRYTSPYYIIPATVLVVHTLLIVFTWTFLAMTINDPIPFPARDAINFQNNTRTVTWVVTAIASAISLLSKTYVSIQIWCLYYSSLKDSPEFHSFYTRAIRYALARRLATRVSLHTVVAGYKMAKPSWIKSRAQPLWLIGSLLCFIAIYFQTTGYDVSSVTFRSTC